MFKLPKLKIRVYFYHLFALTIVMLMCFYLMYRDMKRIEDNMIKIYNKVNENELNNKKLMKQFSDVENFKNSPPKIEKVELSPLSDDNSPVNDNSLKSLLQKVSVLDDSDIKEDKNNQNDNEEDEEKVEDEEVDDDEDEEVDDDEDEEVDDDEDEEVEDKEVDDDKIGKVTIDDDMIDELENDVDELLEDLNENTLEHNTDYSKLTKEELLAKTNNELKNYLKKVGGSVNGAKNKLVENILNLN